MELLVLLFLGGLLTIAIGAIMGIVAKARTNELAVRLDVVERELRALRHASPPPASPSVRAPEPVVDPVEDLADEATDSFAAEPEPQVVAPPVVPPPRFIDAQVVAAPPPPPPTPPPPPPPPPPSSPPVPPVPPAAQAREFPVPKPPDAPSRFEGVEKALGLRGLTWIGVGLLFLGVAFFLKYAYDRDWLGHLFGPRLRIATAAAGAIALGLAGWRSLGNGMVALGHGLLGGGQALLYLTIYAAFQPAVAVVDVPLLGTTAAFVLMVLVTCVGLAVAVRLDAVPTAFLAVLGGFATPVLVSSGQDARDVLCTYLLLLDLGVLLVAAYRRWRALELLAFVGTVVLFGGWYQAWHHLHPQPDAILVWLGAFHLTFLLLPFAHHWRTRTAVTVGGFTLALANVAWTLGNAAWMLREEAPGLLAAGCFGGTALYLGLGLATARRVGADRRTRDGFLALATLLLTVGLLYLLPGNGTTTAWFVEASALLWLGHRFLHRTTRIGAVVVLGAAMLRTLVVHLPQQDRLAGFVWNPWFVTMLVASAGLGTFAWIHRRLATGDGERSAARAIGIGAGLWTLFAGSLEILRHAEGHAPAWSVITPALAIAWLQIAGALAFLLWSVRWAGRATFLAALLPLLAAAVAVGIAYDRYPADGWPGWNGCCVAGAAVCATIALAGRAARRLYADGAFAQALFGLAQLALTALATVEAAAYLQRGDVHVAAPTARQVLGWVWLGCAAGGSLAAAARQSLRMVVLAGIPLLLAAVTGLWLFSDHLQPHRLIANQRFLFALIVSGTLAALRPLLRRVVSPAGADHVAAAALALLLLYAGCESVTWSADSCSGEAVAQWTVWLLGASAVAGSAGGWWRARATTNRSLRGMALLALAPAAVVPLLGYVVGWEADWMFANLRAVLVAAAVATTALWARDDAALRPMRWIAFAIGLMGLTAEPPAWFLDHVAERAEAARLALFSVTVTWLVVAVAMLVIGFRGNVRSVRLTALALFALTALKVLLLDMSGAQQLYRILAFVLVGLVFVGASWLYHRVERRFAAK